MELSEEVKVKLVDQSVKSLDKLNVLINELLDTRRLEQGHLKLDKKLFALSELFEDCRANFTLQTTRKITFGGDLKEKVVADSHQIAQVMVNLINNAIKYAPESDIAVKVNKLDEKELMISIKDNGPQGKNCHGCLKGIIGQTIRDKNFLALAWDFTSVQISLRITVVLSAWKAR